MQFSALVLIWGITIKLTTETRAVKLYWGYKLVKAFPYSDVDVAILSRLKDIKNLTVDMWRPPTHPGSAVDMAVSPEEFIKLKTLFDKYGIHYRVHIYDLQAVINRQNDVHNASLSWHSSYHTFEQIVTKLRVIDQTSGMVRMSSLGKSHENRDLYVLRIQANSQIKKPLVFITCGVHAREWVSPAFCMYTIDKTVSLYGKDSSVTSMLNKVDLAILPVLNVDGYAYSWSKDRLWRKNRSSNNGSVCVGTDLNRNWPFAWGGSDASNHPCMGNYQGSSVMSESEVQHVDRFLKSELNNLVGYLDVHSYSQLWLIPWASKKEKVKDYDALMKVGRAAVDTMKIAGFNTTYGLGAVSRVLYACSGTLQDYVYGSLGIKYSFAVELRDKGAFGFLLPPHLIEPTAIELFEGLKTMIREMNFINSSYQQ